METSVEQQPAVRVLIVEDNDAWRQILADLICDEGFDTVAYGTAVDGRVMGVPDFLNIIVEDSQPTELVGVMIDITERKQDEDALRESEQNIRLMFAHHPLSMWVYNRERHMFLDVKGAALVNLATHAKNFFR